MIDNFKYRAPTSRSELLALLATHADGAKVLAGGTDLLVDIRNSLVRPEIVINLKKVEDFAELSWSKSDGLVIGPTTTLNDLLSDEKVRESYPLLVQCGLTIATHQLRNRATVIGNIVHASPGADMAPGLLCLGAQVKIASQRTQREVPLKDFFTGVKKSVLKPDEIVEAIVVPPDTAGARGSYSKLKRIEGHDLSLVGVAVARNDGVVRVSIGSAAPTPLLLDGLRADLPVEEVVSAVKHVVRPISDLRSSKEYREFMIEVFVRRLFQEVQ